MKINLDAPSEEVRIEVVPLIDVIFCILTFFILGAVGLARQQAINVDLPRASTGTPQMREMMIVSLDPFGQVYINQINQEPILVNQEQLNQKLQEYRQQNPNDLIVLNSSKEVRYDRVVQVLDWMRQVGGDRVALAVLPGQSKDQLPANTPIVPFNPGNSGVQISPPVNIPISPNVPGNSGNNLGQPNLTNPGNSGNNLSQPNNNITPGDRLQPPTNSNPGLGQQNPAPNIIPNQYQIPINTPGQQTTPGSNSSNNSGNNSGGNSGAIVPPPAPKNQP